MTDAALGSPNNKVILNQFVPAALELLQDLPEQGATANQRLDYKWNSKWKKVYSCSTIFIRNDAYSKPA